MGLGTAAIKLNLDLWEDGLYNNIKSVMDFGSQDLHIKLKDFEKFIETYNVPHYKRENFLDLNNWPGKPRCSSKPFYELLGVEQYVCVDMNRKHHALPIDLNKPLNNELAGLQFDMVTDHGTNEHVFHAAQAYKTMHRLCKKGGLIVIAQILYPFNIDHGYYRFDPFMFKSLSIANNYRILYSSYVVCSETKTPNGSWYQFHIPLENELLHVIDFSRLNQLGVCYVLQKQTDDDFREPYQLM